MKQIDHILSVDVTLELEGEALPVPNTSLDELVVSAGVVADIDGVVPASEAAAAIIVVLTKL